MEEAEFEENEFADWTDEELKQVWSDTLCVCENHGREVENNRRPKIAV